MGPETIIALAVGGMLLVLCEIFVPGGIIGGAGALLLLVAIVAGFIHDPTWGFWLLISTLLLGSCAFFLWIKYFPRTSMGKRLFLANDASDWHGFDTTNQQFEGREGVAHSTLRPAGTAIIDEQRVDVVTRGEMVEADSRIRVIEVEGNRVVVTKI